MLQEIHGRTPQSLALSAATSTQCPSQRGTEAHRALGNLCAASDASTQMGPVAQRRRRMEFVVPQGHFNRVLGNRLEPPQGVHRDAVQQSIPILVSRHTVEQIAHGTGVCDPIVVLFDAGESVQYVRFTQRLELPVLAPVVHEGPQRDGLQTRAELALGPACASCRNPDLAAFARIDQGYLAALAHPVTPDHKALCAADHGSFSSGGSG